MKKLKEDNFRTKCYECMRPSTSCMCEYVYARDTNTKFVLLMHPHEYRKVKNPTGTLTNLQLKNSEIIVGIDFTDNSKVNGYIENFNCYVLYPGLDQIDITSEQLPTKKDICIFIIDTTWPRAKKIIKLSQNLKNLQFISFQSQERSKYKIKQQPNEKCLSTIESTKVLLKNLAAQNVESLENLRLDNFLLPFEKMVEYQIKCTLDPSRSLYRSKSKEGANLRKMDNYKKNPMTNIFYKGFDS